MIHSNLSLGLCFTAALALIACTESADDVLPEPPGGSRTTVEDLCRRADECNLLQGSVAECISDRNLCLSDLTAQQQSDWAREIESCLSYDTCQLAIDCYWEVPWC